MHLGRVFETRWQVPFGRAWSLPRCSELTALSICCRWKYCGGPNRHRQVPTDPCVAGALPRGNHIASRAAALPRGQLQLQVLSITNCSEHSSRGRLRLQSHCIRERLPLISDDLALTLLVCRRSDINLQGTVASNFSACSDCPPAPGPNNGASGLDWQQPKRRISPKCLLCGA